MKLPKIFKNLNLLSGSLVILFISISILYPISFYHSTKAKASEEEDIQKAIDKAKKELEKTDSDLSNIQEKAAALSAQIGSLSGKLNITDAELKGLEKQRQELITDIDNLEKKMNIKNDEIETRKKIRNLTLKSLYKENQKGLFVTLLTEKDLSIAIEKTQYIKQFINTSETLIGTINGEIQRYDSDKKEIEEIKTKTEAQQKELEKIANQLASQVSAAKNNLSSVSQEKIALQDQLASINKKLSELSAKQKALLEEKTGSFTTSVGDVPTTGDSHARADYDPGFRKAFAAFSFGAPHRKGMSQYGAKGRAEEGQSYKDILKGYYGDVNIEKKDIPSTIRTDQGTFDLDGKYLNGLAEMPSDWPMEALKAQAIAARTYALAYIGWRTDNTSPSGSICTTENCQVWSSSKASSSSAARWHQAVSETKGIIMTGKDSGEIFSALYAATSGGYNYSYSSLGHKTNGGWDTTCNSKDCWTSKAYESIGGSPWFYKGWYKTRSGLSCNRDNPWLTEKEFADIVGALVLYKENSDNQTHLSQVDAKSCWGDDISDTWSMDKVKEKTGITEIKEINVEYSSGGYTSKVKIKTNKDEYSFTGEEFKAIFNLRAPGAIHLKSALFNIEFKK